MISFWPILAAGVAHVIIGMAWYHPRVFGTAWMRLTGLTPEMQERGKQRLAANTAITLLAGMLIAYVMTYFGYAWGVYDALGGIELGFWLWLGFVATTMLNTVLWEQKPFKLYLINSLHWLVSFLVMGMIVSTF